MIEIVGVALRAVEGRLLSFRCLSVLLAMVVFGLAGTSSGHAQVERDVFHHLVSLPPIDATSPAALYAAYQHYSLPAQFAFSQNHTKSRRLILDRLVDVIRQAVPLGQLRAAPPAGAHASDRIISASRSGPDSRRILPTRVPWHRETKNDVNGTVIDEPGIATFQFMSLVSTVVRLAVAFPATDPGVRAAERTTLAYLARFLVDDWVVPYWTTVEAWHYQGPFPNMRLRFEARLDPTRTWPKRYFAGFHDEDLFYLATAADLGFVLRRDPELLGETGVGLRDTLDDINSIGLRVLRARIPEGEGFVFGAGDWWQHPDDAWAGCITTSFPKEPCPRRDVSEDISHASRWPFWLESMLGGQLSGSPNEHYLRGLIDRLAWQFGTKVVSWDEHNRPAMRNFLDGVDGWYQVGRYGPTFGYGPSSLGAAVAYGSWFALARYGDPNVRRFGRALCELMRSNDPDDIAFRIRHFGAHRNAPQRASGNGDIDIGGAGSQVDYSCSIATALGAF